MPSLCFWKLLIVLAQSFSPICNDPLLNQTATEATALAVAEGVEPWAVQAHGTSVRRARETPAYSFFSSKQRSARASEDRGSKNSMLRHFGGIRIGFESFGGKCARFIAGVNNHKPSRFF